MKLDIYIELCIVKASASLEELVFYNKLAEMLTHFVRRTTLATKQGDTKKLADQRIRETNPKLPVQQNELRGRALLRTARGRRTHCTSEGRPALLKVGKRWSFVWVMTRDRLSIVRALELEAGSGFGLTHLGYWINEFDLTIANLLEGEENARRTMRLIWKECKKWSRTTVTGDLRKKRLAVLNQLLERCGNEQSGGVKEVRRIVMEAIKSLSRSEDPPPKSRGKQEDFDWQVAKLRQQLVDLRKQVPELSTGEGNGSLVQIFEEADYDLCRIAKEASAAFSADQEE